MGENGNSGFIGIENVHEYAKDIIDTMRDPFLILGVDLKVILANRAFYRTFQTTPEETENQLIFSLGNQQWDVPKLKELLNDVLPSSITFDDYKVEHDFPSIGRRIMLLNARRIPRPPAKPKLILLAMVDVTGSKLIEDLHDKIKQLEIFTVAATGREERIIELKNKVKELEAEIIKIRKIT